MKLLSCLILATALAYGQASLEVQLKAAMHKEHVEGDLKGAIEAYRKIAAQAGANREIAARSLLRLALAYQKQGGAQARQTLELLVRDFSDQQQVVTEARGELARMDAGVKGTVTQRKLWEAEWETPQSASSDGRLVSLRNTRSANAAILDLRTGEKRYLTQYGNWDMVKGTVQDTLISPDGRWLAFSVQVQKGWEFRAVRSDGSNPVTVFRGAPGTTWVTPISWTSDSRDVYFRVALERPQGSAQMRGRYDLFRITVPGGVVKTIKEDFLSVGGGGLNMKLSPDGRWFAFSTPRSPIEVMPAQGGSAAELVLGPGRNTVVGWSPDGKYLLFGSDRTGTQSLHRVAIHEGKVVGDAELVRQLPGAISTLGIDARGTAYYLELRTTSNAFVAQLDGEGAAFTKEPTRVTNRFEGHNAAPIWSPDGSKLAWFALGGGGNLTQIAKIVVRDVAGGREQEIVPQIQAQIGVSPAWLSSGNSIILGTQNNMYRWSLHKVSAETGSTTLLRQDAAVGMMHPSWSRDGSQVYRYNFPDNGVYVWDAATNSERQLFKDPGADFVRHFVPSPDGSQVAFISHKNPPPGSSEFYGDVGLKVFDVASGQARELVKVRPAWMRHPLTWTSDGKHIIYATEWYAGHPDDATRLWVVPAAGGTPKQLGKDFQGRVFGLTVSPDGRQLGFDVHHSSTELWALENFLSTAPAK